MIDTQLAQLRLDPSHGFAHAPGVASLRQKINAERKMRELLEDNDLPAPDEVEYGHTCIRLLWHQQKAAVVVDIDEVGEEFGGNGVEPRWR
jgi:diadenosine tetraphosphatase ApaH/serine/threonine PP2A family protein phosphatase